MQVVFVLALAIAAVAAGPDSRVTGGESAAMTDYPSVVALLHTLDGNVFTQECGATIVSTKYLLTAAQCLHGDKYENFRFRAGSATASRGGTEYTLSNFIIHPQYVSLTKENDIALMRTLNPIALSSVISIASLAGANYALPSEQSVWAVGWGAEVPGGPHSEKLQKVQLKVVDQNVCVNNYKPIKKTVTDEMLCAAVMTGEKGQCDGDAGSPLFHNKIVVGFYSWSNGCGAPGYPSVNTRVSSYSDWIHSNMV